MFNAAWTEPIAEALKNLGSVHAWVVHGSDGLDEITTTGPTRVTELKDGKIRSFEVTPRGCRAAAGDAWKTSRAAMPRSMPRRSATCWAASRVRSATSCVLNAAAALIVGGKAADLTEGAERAARAIDDGSAARALDKLVAVTNEAS